MTFKRISQLDPLPLLTAQFRRSHIAISQVNLEAHALRLSLLFKPHKRKYLNRVSLQTLNKNIQAMTDLTVTEADCLKYTALVFSDWQRGYFTLPTQGVRLSCPYCVTFHCKLDVTHQHYQCENPECRASVGAWSGDNLPMGTPAHAPLLQLRRNIELSIAPLLTAKIINKTELEKMLNKKLGRKGLFNIHDLNQEQCALVRAVIDTLQPLEKAG